MKFFSFILVLLIAVSYSFIGCDSVSDSKPINTTPPTLISPADNDSNISLTPTFTWSGTADKLSYSTNSSFTNAVTLDVSGTQHTLGTALNRSTTYFWKAGITSGGNIIWSTVYYRFRTIN